MLQEAREGEARLADNNDTRVRLRRLLNLPDKVGAASASVEPLPPASAAPKINRRTPGVRSPQRDQIGLPRDQAGKLQVSRA